MTKVKTIKSSIRIRSEHFPEICKRLSNHRESPENLKNCGIHCLLDKFGWKARYNYKTREITALELRAEKFPAKGHLALMVLARYIEPGGVIHICDDVDQRYWAYHFDGRWFQRRFLTRWLVDLESKEDLRSHLDQVVAKALAQGFSRQELHQLIDSKLSLKVLGL